MSDAKTDSLTDRRLPPSQKLNARFRPRPKFATACSSARDGRVRVVGGPSSGARSGPPVIGQTFHDETRSFAP